MCAEHTSLMSSLEIQPQVQQKDMRILQQDVRHLSEDVLFRRRPSQESRYANGRHSTDETL